MHLKSIFARHGIPDTVISDNGPQYSATVFSNFSKEYGFTHVTSSPRYPQANGEAERAVKTVKELLKKNDDPYLAILAYRSTPLENGYSPAELLMGRRLRTTVPTINQQLIPQLPEASKLHKEKNLRQRQKKNFDRRFRTRELKPLEKGDKVWITDSNTKGTVVENNQPRSYVVVTDGGTYQRNRRHLVQLPGDGAESNLPQPTEPAGVSPGPSSSPPRRLVTNDNPNGAPTASPGSRTRQGTRYK